MMMRTLAACAVMTVFLTAPVAADAAEGSCEGLSGKELKACKKKQKELASTTPYVPSDLGAPFKSWDGEANPYNTDPYSVRVKPSGFSEVDEYLGKVWRVQAIVAGSKYVVDQAQAGDKEAIAMSPEIMDLLIEVPEILNGLKDESSQLVSNLTDILQGPDALKIPKVTASILDASGAALATAGDVPKLLKSLESLAKDSSAATSAATEMAVDAATEEVNEAVEDATDGE